MYGSTLYIIGIAMVVPILQYIRKFSFYFQFQVNLHFYMTKHVETKVYTKYWMKIPLMSKVMLKWILQQR